MYIDTHTHITWGIDDGIQTLDECLDAINQCKEDGIERVIATPHFIPGRHNHKKLPNLQRNLELYI